MRALVRSVVTAVALVLVSSVVLAARPGDLSIDQLTRNAGAIVEGQVTAVRSEWTSNHTQIYTSVTLQVSQVLKGSIPGSQMDLRLLGGTVDDITMLIIDQPTFEVNERVFLFLRPNYEVRDVPLVGQSAGKFRVEVDATGADVLHNDGTTISKSDGVRIIRAIPQPTQR
jgi:hypothetical protein